MSAARSISRDFYRTGKAILAGNIFLRIPDTIKSGKFVVSMFDGPSVVVRHDGKMIAGAYLSSSTIDGIADLEFMEKCGHSRKRKCVDLIVKWVEQYKKEVYPASSRILQKEREQNNELATN